MVAVSQIEGRTDDVLQFADGKSIFPDFIRRTITGVHRNITNYQIIQEAPDLLSLYVYPESHWDEAAHALTQLLETHYIPGIAVQKATNKAHVLGTKFRRIHARRH